MHEFEHVTSREALVDIDPRIINALEVFHGYAPFVEEWIIIKKNIILMIPSDLRKQFSRRHEKTKYQLPNELEFALMQRWTALTGKQVIFNNDGKEGKISPP